MEHSEGFLKIASEAKSKIKETTIDHVKKRIDAGEKFCLIDVREESEFAAGHIKGALHLSKGIIERDIEKKFPNKNQELVLYCGGGFRSALVCESVQRMGYKNLVSMDGGWRGWQEKNYPTEK